MFVPESFFNGEIRDGFYVEKLMKKVWAAQIEILNDVDAFCKIHNIQYFADWGTLLGAVRHKGFIPWDDDMDISMKREGYIRFCNLAQQKLKENYEILNVYTDKNWKEPFTRIINKRYLNFDKQRLEKFHGCPFVVGIDIFPIDAIPGTQQENDLLCKVLRILQMTINEFQKNRLTQSEQLSILDSVEEMCGIQFQHNKPYINQLRELREKICMLYTESETIKISNSIVEYAIGVENYIYPKEYYDEVIKLPFEYTTIQVPKEYEKILIQEYGKDYMKPSIGCSAHDYPFYKEQLLKLYEANDNK